MDTMHPHIRLALETEREKKKQPEYAELLILALDVNERCMAIVNNADHLGIVVAKALLDIEHSFEEMRITREQRDRLREVLKEGIPEPDDARAFTVHFPSTDPPPRAA